MAVVKISIDGREIGTFRNGEYETLEVAPGAHRVRAGMRGLAFITMGWNEHGLDVKPGEVVYLQIQIRVDSQEGSPLGTPSGLEIGGRSDHRVSENVFLIERSRAEAIGDLQASTRIVQRD